MSSSSSSSSAFIQYQKLLNQQQQNERRKHNDKNNKIAERHASRIVAKNTSNNNNNNNKINNKKNGTTNVKAKEAKKSTTTVQPTETDTNYRPNNTVTNPNVPPILDLHGYRLEEALRAVTEFLEKQRRAVQQKQKELYDAIHKASSSLSHSNSNRSTATSWQLAQERSKGNKKTKGQRQQELEALRRMQNTKTYCLIVTGLGSHSGQHGGPILRTAIENLIQRRQMEYTIEKPGQISVNPNSGIQFYSNNQLQPTDTKVIVSSNTTARPRQLQTHLSSMSSSSATARRNYQPMKKSKKGVIDDEYIQMVSKLKKQSLVDIQEIEEIAKNEAQECKEAYRLSLLENSVAKIQYEQEEKLLQQTIEESKLVYKNVRNFVEDEIEDDNEEALLQKAIEESKRLHEEEEKQKRLFDDELALLQKALEASEREYTNEEEEDARLLEEAIRISKEYHVKEQQDDGIDVFSQYHTYDTYDRTTNGSACASPTTSSRSGYVDDQYFDSYHHPYKVVEAVTINSVTYNDKTYETSTNDCDEDDESDDTDNNDDDDNDDDDCCTADEVDHEDDNIQNFTLPSDNMEGLDTTLRNQSLPNSSRTIEYYTEEEQEQLLQDVMCMALQLYDELILPEIVPK